jgi:predicted CXXCH cytochrome family protein
MLALAAGALASAAADFSHRVHLEMEMTCGQCHTAARASTKATDNLLPSSAVCRECHDDGRTVRTKPTGAFVTRFNHSRHVGLSVATAIAAAVDKGTYLSAPAAGLRARLTTKNACEACHRGLRESDAVAKVNFPAMADCLVCHNQIDVPFSCTQCHDASQPLRPVTHTADFIDLHSSGKAKLDKPSCAVCHGRSFTCQGCH